MAVHLYTASGATTDVDAEFGGASVIYFDTNYNSNVRDAVALAREVEAASRRVGPG